MSDQNFRLKERNMFLTMLEQSHTRIGVSLELSLSKDGRHFCNNAKSQKSLGLNKRLTWNIKPLEFHRVSWYNIWPCLISSVVTKEKLILQWCTWETVTLRSPSQSTSERCPIRQNHSLHTSKTLELSRDIWLCSVTGLACDIHQGSKMHLKFGCNLLGGLHSHLVCKERYLPTCPCLDVMKSMTVGSFIWNTREDVQSLSSHYTCHARLVFIGDSLWPSIVVCINIFKTLQCFSDTCSVVFCLALNYTLLQKRI